MSELKLNPALRSIVNRTRQVGLHKVARTLHGHDIDLSSVVQRLGHDLTLHHQKHARVQDGVRALAELEENGIVTLEKRAFLNMLRQGLSTAAGAARKGWGALGDAGAKAGRAMNKSQTLGTAGGVPTQAHLAQGAANIGKAENIGRNVAQYGTVGAAGTGLGLGGAAMMSGNKQAGARDMAGRAGGALRKGWDDLGEWGAQKGEDIAKNRSASKVKEQMGELPAHVRVQHPEMTPLFEEEMARFIAEKAPAAAELGRAAGKPIAQYGAAGLGAAGLGGMGYGASRLGSDS